MRRVRVNDFVISEGGKKVELLQTDIEDWADHAGGHGNPLQFSGERLMAVRKHLEVSPSSWSTTATADHLPSTR